MTIEYKGYELSEDGERGTGERERVILRSLIDKTGKFGTSAFIDYRDYDSFNACLNAIGSSNTSATNYTILIPDIISISANTSAHNNLTLMVIDNGQFNINTGIGLTINGNIEISNRKITFEGSGNVTINGSFSNDPNWQIFGSSIVVDNTKNGYYKPEWYGAIGDGLIDDTAAWNRLINSLYGGPFISAAPLPFTNKKTQVVNVNPSKFYLISDTLDFREKWNLKMVGKGRAFNRLTTDYLETFVWKSGIPGKEMLLFHYNFGLTIEDISCNGNNTIGTVGFSYSIANTANSSVKFVNIIRCDVVNCDMGHRVADYSASGPDNAAFVINSSYVSNCLTYGISVDSGNALVTINTPHLQGNGFNPQGGKYGCNLYIGAGQVKVFGYESAGSGTSKPDHSDIYKASGSLSIFGGWSDCHGTFYKEGSVETPTILMGIRHYEGAMSESNTPTSIICNGKTVVQSCYLFGDIECDAGISGSLTLMAINFHNVNLGTMRPTLGIGKPKGTIITTQLGLIDINNLGNNANIMIGGGTRDNFNPIQDSPPAISSFGKDLIECLGPSNGDSGYNIDRPNPANGDFFIKVNCYFPSRLSGNLRAYKAGPAFVLYFSSTGLTLYTTRFADTTTDKTLDDFSIVSKLGANFAVGYESENAIFLPQLSGAPTFNSGNIWLGGMLFDKLTSKPTISVDGTIAGFKSFALETNDVNFSKVTSTSAQFTSGINITNGNVNVSNSVIATNGLITSGGLYNSGHLTLGSYHLWIDDTGRLRVKNGTPLSATDGSVVGTQT